MGVVVACHADLRAGQTGLDQARDFVWAVIGGPSRDGSAILPQAGVPGPATWTGPDGMIAAGPLEPAAMTAATDALSTLIARGRRVLATEARPLRRSSIGSGASSRTPARLLLACKGRIVVHRHGQVRVTSRSKIAATLASTGQPGVLPAPGRGDPRRHRHDHGGATSCSRCRTPARPTSCVDHPAGDQASRRAADRADRRAATRRSPLRERRARRERAGRKRARSISRRPRAPTATLAMGDALAVAMLEARGFTEPTISRARTRAARSAAGCCCTSRT